MIEKSDKINNDRFLAMFRNKECRNQCGNETKKNSAIQSVPHINK